MSVTFRAHASETACGIQSHVKVPGDCQRYNATPIDQTLITFPYSFVSVHSFPHFARVILTEEKCVKGSLWNLVERRKIDNLTNVQSLLTGDTFLTVWSQLLK